MEKYFTYVLLNIKNKKIYIGQTNNLELRIKRHNKLIKSKASSYSSKNLDNGIWKIIYSEEYNSRKQAIIRERQLKSYRGRQFIKNLIIQLVDPPAGGLLSDNKQRAASSVGRAIAS